MDAQTQNPTTVVVATDGSAPAAAAVEWAAQEAVSRKQPLLIVTACQPPALRPLSEQAVGTTVSLPEIAQVDKREYQKLVQDAAIYVGEHYPDLIVTTEVFSSDPRDALQLYESLASVVVLGSRGLGSVRSVLLGSVSFWATRHLTAPFVVVRPPDPDQLTVPHRVAVGVASHDPSEITLRSGFALAARRGCPLTIANAAWDNEAVGNNWAELPLEEVDLHRRNTVTDVVERVAKEFPNVKYTVLFARGRVDYFLASLGRSHEAVVLGRGQSTFLDFVSLGTLASFVVEHGVGAIMIVPAEGELL